jgi:hypothetical protein
VLRLFRYCLAELFGEVFVGLYQLLVCVSELCHDFVICGCRHREGVDGGSEVDCRAGAMEVVLVGVELLLFSFKSLYAVAKNGLKATHVWLATGLRRHSLHVSLYRPLLLIAC